MNKNEKSTRFRGLIKKTIELLFDFLNLLLEVLSIDVDGCMTIFTGYIMINRFSLENYLVTTFRTFKIKFFVAKIKFEIFHKQSPFFILGHASTLYLKDRRTNKQSQERRREK